VRTAFPLVFAGPGGYYVEVDGELVQRRRKELGLSMGRLAEQVGVSRRTLYGYERGLGKASVASAYNLTKVLGVAVAKPVNILQRTQKQNQCLIRKNQQAHEEHVMLKKVFRNFACCDVTHVQQAPFDFVANLPDEKAVILGAIATADERFLDDRVNEILSICKVIGAYPVLVVGNKKPSAQDIFCVRMDELSEMHSPTEIVASY
jgi:putative transcriptional regulator